MGKKDLKYFLQKIHLVKRNQNFNNKYYLNKYKKLKNKISRDTFWLNAEERGGHGTKSLTFYEKAVKYYEYKNMIIQRKIQYAIIFLTFVLLIMTGFQIYLTFFK